MSIKSIIQKSIDTKARMLESDELVASIQQCADAWVSCLNKKGKVLFCGNGGSAADAQHIAAELSGRFYFDRAPLFAEALHVNTSYLTAVANDYSYDVVYERMVQSKGAEGDVLVGISTGGNSKNVVLAMKEAQRMGMVTIGFTGEAGGEMRNYSDILINIPSTDTPRIQECHILVGHIICELTEASLFERKD
jgi:D-sedoheptulose 7-phosphate isomerase